jgi:hypothetical protein
VAFVVSVGLCGLALVSLQACSGAGSQSHSGGAGSSYVVSMLQSPVTEAANLTVADIAALVGGAVSQAGGMDFIHDGQTVVLKPNLPTVYQDNGETLASPTVSGINTDWRVTKSVADLVRAKNPTGKILIMEGSTFATNIAYAALGYTSENLGSLARTAADFGPKPIRLRGLDQEHAPHSRRTKRGCRRYHASPRHEL